MAKHVVTICCWDKGHQTDLVMNIAQEEALYRKIQKMKAVCPDCRNIGNGNRAIFTKHSNGKIYQCPNGHVTTVTPFNKNMLHVKFGNESEEFTNIYADVEELDVLIDNLDISCHHCAGKLKAIDDSQISHPKVPGIKTKTRVGDIWDKRGIEPVRNGSYDGDGNYSATSTEKANRARLKEIRKQRNIQESRLEGRSIVDRPTDTTYKRRNKSDIDS